LDSREHRAHELAILELDVYLAVRALGLDCHALPTKVSLHVDHITNLHLWSWRLQLVLRLFIYLG
jgi:hypothetical protein